jgi:hypothetical protein
VKQWPDKNISVMVTSPQISFEQYPNNILGKEEIIHTMVGDLQRIIEYPKLGFQIEQEVPPLVLEALEQLVADGYTDHLLK